MPHILLGAATPEAGRELTDDGEYRERRTQFKHRAHGDTRSVSICPELAKILRAHITTVGKSPDGKLSTGVKGGQLPAITIRRAWKVARKVALTEAEQKSPLARRIYDLRHACLSCGQTSACLPPRSPSGRGTASPPCRG